jgi:hypothetical protein
MIDLRNPLGVPTEDQDRVLKAEILHILQTDPNRYWRDQKMQDAFFGLLQREEAGGISERTAKSMIEGNLPDYLKSQADLITSQEFMELWRQKVEGGEGYGNFSRSEPYVAKPRTAREPTARWFLDQDAIRNILSTYGKPTTNKP